MLPHNKILFLLLLFKLKHWCCCCSSSILCCCATCDILVAHKILQLLPKTQYIYGVHISTCLLFRYIALSMPLNKLEIAAVQNTTLLLPKLNTNHAKSASVRNHLGCSSTQRAMSWTTLILMCAISQWNTMSCGS